MYDTALLKTEQGFSRLYSEYAPVLYGIIRHMVKDPVLAEDVLQDVFIKAWNKSHQFQSEKGRLFTWLYTIARNTAIDYNKAEQRHQTETAHYADIYSSKYVKGFNIDTVYLSRSIHSLPPTQRTILQKAFYYGFTVHEIAQQLNIPEGTVKTRMRAALHNLRQEHTSKKKVVAAAY